MVHEAAQHGCPSNEAQVLHFVCWTFDRALQVNIRPRLGGQRTSRSLTGRAWSREAASGMAFARNIALAWFNVGPPRLHVAGAAGAL